MLSGPISAQLEITEKCNYQCTHCYRLDDQVVSQSSCELSDQQILSLASKLIDSGIMSLIITGGEPLIKKGLVLDLIELATRRNIHCSINTNLVLINEDYLSKLIELGVDSLLISCPSSDPATYKLMTTGGSIDKLFSKLDLVLASDIRYTVNMVVNRNNLHQVISTAHELAERGVRSFSAAPMAFNMNNPYEEAFLTSSEVAQLIDELVWINDNIGIKVDIMEAIPKCVFSQKARESKLPFLRRQCQAGRSVISVSPTGEVRPCSHNPDSYGKLVHENLNIIWDRMITWRSGAMIPNICKECKMLAKCFGGCRINAKVTSGQLSGPDPLCTKPVDFFESKLYNQVAIDANTVLGCPKKLRWRYEGNSTYLIFGRNPNSVIRVSAELYRFVVALRQSPVRRFQEIIGFFDIKDTEQFRSILQGLVDHQILSIEE